MPAPETGNPFDEAEPTAVTSVRDGEVLAGTWRIERKLGQGGMGSVYFGKDLALDRPVAIKVMSPEHCSNADVVARFEREARALAKLEHPNIVPLFAVGRRGAQPYLVMKYLDGQSLFEVRQGSGGRIEPEKLLPMLRQICAGLTHLHEAGFVHRDLKPANLFLARNGQVYILDLGIVREQQNSNTRTGIMMGTPAYMSPEQAVGEREIDLRSDIYSLAVVVFEALSGVPPYQADSDFKVILAHVQSPVPSILEAHPDLAPALVPVLQRALAKRAFERQASAAEFLAELEHAIANPQIAPPTGAVTKVSAAVVPKATPLPTDTALREAVAPRRPWAVLLLLACAVFGAGGGVWWATRDSAPPPTPTQTIIVRPTPDPARAPVPVPAPAPAPVPVIAKVHLKFESTPPGAAVDRIDTLETLGTTPFEVSLNKGPESFLVELTLAGYKPVRKTVTAEGDATISLKLTRLPSAAPSRTPPKPDQSEHGTLNPFGN